MTLTPDIIKAAYVFLKATPPFRYWRMPPVDEIAFRVVKSRSIQAWFQASGRGSKRKRTLAVSTNCVGYTNTLIGAVAHEMVHVYMDVQGLDTTGEHNEKFYKLAKRACRVLGADPKTF